MRIIINADDLGRNKVVDDAIEKCMVEGTINSTTIMANGEDFENVKAITERHPEISYGVHLVIDEMECLTKPPIFVDRGVMDEKGYFIKGGIRKAKFDKALKMAVYDEWCAQIDKIRAEGVNIDHIDSHHHLHTMPEMFCVLRRISRKYGIRKVRITTHTPHYLHIKTVAVVHKNAGTKLSVNMKSSLAKRIIGVAKSYFVYHRLHLFFDTTDLFCSVSTYCANKSVIDSYKGYKSIELMCHPGHEDYVRETELLRAL